MPDKPDDRENASPRSGRRQTPPPGYRLIHEGLALPPFYAAEMLRPLIGRTVWVLDSGGRVRNGELQDVPWTKEHQGDEHRPATFADGEKPLYLRSLVCIAVYDPSLMEL